MTNIALTNPPDAGFQAAVVAEVLRQRLPYAIATVSKGYPAIQKAPADNETVMFEGKSIKVGMSTMMQKPLSLDKSTIMALHDHGKLTWGEIFMLGAADFLDAKHAAEKPQAPATPKPGSMEAMQAELDRLKAENDKLRASKGGGRLSLKVSEKGALSAYGLGRFPVTLYREQWERLLAMADDIKAFIEANADKLTTKQ